VGGRAENSGGHVQRAGSGKHAVGVCNDGTGLAYDFSHIKSVMRPGQAPGPAPAEAALRVVVALPLVVDSVPRVAAVCPMLGISRSSARSCRCRIVTQSPGCTRPRSRKCALLLKFL
jgi:hypothetical protein